MSVECPSRNLENISEDNLNKLYKGLLERVQTIWKN